jgi:hypothetical protein
MLKYSEHLDICCMSVKLLYTKQCILIVVTMNQNNTSLKSVNKHWRRWFAYQLRWGDLLKTIIPRGLADSNRIAYNHVKHMSSWTSKDLDKVPMQRNFYLIFYCFSKKYCWSDEKWRLQFRHISSHSQVIALSIFWVVMSQAWVEIMAITRYLGEYLVKFNETWYT